MVGSTVDLSILVVGYESSSFLAACLRSIPAAAARHRYEILFVNNGTDQSEKVVLEAAPVTRVLPSLGNIGFAAGNDYLAEHAEGKWLLLLNPDTRLYPDALDVLLDAAERNPEFVVFGGLTVDRDGEAAARSDLSLPNLKSLFREFVWKARRSASAKGLSDVSPVQALSGGFMMVRHDWWTQLNGLDRSFFLYAEELDFFKRLNDAGGRAAQVFSSLLYHDFGSGEVYSPARIRYMATGNAHYFHKHFSPAHAYACVILMWATMIKRYIGGRILAVRSDHYARVSKGFSDVARAPWTWMWGYNSPGADPRKIQ